MPPASTGQMGRATPAAATWARLERGAPRVSDTGTQLAPSLDVGTGWDHPGKWGHGWDHPGDMGMGMGWGWVPTLARDKDQPGKMGSVGVEARVPS